MSVLNIHADVIIFMINKKRFTTITKQIGFNPCLSSFWWVILELMPSFVWAIEMQPYRYD